MPGWLLAGRRVRDGWRVGVEWSTVVDLNHLGWFAAVEVRDAPARAAAPAGS
jgi:hypothetical protein